MKIWTKLFGHWAANGQKPSNQGPSDTIVKPQGHGVSVPDTRPEDSSNRYSRARQVIAEAEMLWQDNSGLGEEQWSKALVGLSPESIKAIGDRGWSKRGTTEPTNEFLVRVLAHIAAEKSLEERKQAIGALRSVLDLPDDNTTGFSNLRGACVRELDSLKALPGGAQQDFQPSSAEQPFQLGPIESSDIGPIGDRPPNEKPNLESQSVWRLVLYPEQDFEQVIKQFETNYTRWQKSFDRRSLSLVLSAYGFSLERVGRLQEAVIAHRWACKLYPFKGFGSCDALPNLEARLAEVCRRMQSA